MPSDKEVFGGVATWEPCRLVQKDARCFNLFTSDVYMFLGNHALSTALPLDSNQHARTEVIKTLLQKFHAPDVMAKCKDAINRIKIVRVAQQQQGRW